MVLTSLALLPCSATSERPCIVLARADEVYVVRLLGVAVQEEHTIKLTFDYHAQVGNRLEVADPYSGLHDELEEARYLVVNTTHVLCVVLYAGLESGLLGDERARLEISSEAFHASLAGLDLPEPSVEFRLPPAAAIVIALFSLLPFFLKMPDVIEGLQEQLSATGVHGRIVQVLLPLVTIALTILLLEGLDVFRW
jgi:hypothetical protein